MPNHEPDSHVNGRVEQAPAGTSAGVVAGMAIAAVFHRQPDRVGQTLGPFRCGHHAGGGSASPDEPPHWLLMASMGRRNDPVVPATVTHTLFRMACATLGGVKIVRTAHFQREQAADDITESEIALAWMRPELERESQDHPGALMRTATVPGDSRVTVVGRQAGETLIFITTWRH